MKNQPLLFRVKNAWQGIVTAWNSEHSFRFQLSSGATAVVFLAWWGLTPLWWAIVILMIALVLAGELINSSIEALADHLHPQQHPAIGRVKDLAAGMVLVTSIAAMIVGLLALWANR